MAFIRFTGLAWVCLSCVLVACTSTGRNYVGSNLQETLEIEILPNTSKMFVYRLRTPEDRMPGGVRIAREGGGRREEGEGGRGGVSLDRSSLTRMHENAAFVVQHMGYCREGFLEIDSSVSPFNLWLKGECKDGATDDDIKKFGTKQTLPVTLAK